MLECSVTASLSPSASPGAGSEPGFLDRVRTFWSRTVSGPSLTERRALYEGLASMSAAGIALRQTLDSLGQRRSERVGRFLAVLSLAADGGDPLSPAMERYPELFTPLETSLVRQGERSGRLDEAFRAVGAHLDRVAAMRSSLVNACLYPLFVAHVALLLPTIPIIGFKYGLGGYLMFVVPALALFWGGLVFAVTAHCAMLDTRGYSRVMLRVPIIGGALENAALARFTRSFSILHDSGARMDAAVEDSAGACGNGWLRDELLTVVPRVRGGESLTTSIAAVSALPPEVLSAVSTGEQSGSLTESFARLAGLFEERLDNRLHRIKVMLPPVIFLLIAIPIAIFILNFYAGLYGDLLK